MIQCNDYLNKIIQGLKSPVQHQGLLPTFGHCLRVFWGAGGGPNVAPPESEPAFPAVVFDFSQRDTIKGLFLFDSQKRQYCFNYSNCFFIRYLPTIKKFSVWGRGLLTKFIATKKRIGKINCFRFYLFYRNPFRIRWLFRITDNPHGIRTFFNSYGTVRINNSGQIGQFNLFHKTSVAEYKSLSELNQEYIDMAMKRIGPLLNQEILL